LETSELSVRVAATRQRSGIMLDNIEVEFKAELDVRQTPSVTKRILIMDHEELEEEIYKFMDLANLNPADIVVDLIDANCSGVFDPPPAPTPAPFVDHSPIHKFTPHDMGRPMGNFSNRSNATNGSNSSNRSNGTAVVKALSANTSQTELVSAAAEPAEPEDDYEDEGPFDGSDNEP